jgi:hypothetical protein
VTTTFAIVQATNFRERAEALAEEVERKGVPDSLTAERSGSTPSTAKRFRSTAVMLTGRLDHESSDQQVIARGEGESAVAVREREAAAPPVPANRHARLSVEELRRRLLERNINDCLIATGQPRATRY